MEIKHYFKILKQAFKTHKAVAKHLGLSYSQYNVWRWNPKGIPASGKKLLELAANEVLDLLK